MASLNKAQIIGHLGRDPEVRFMPNGTPVCNLAVATTRSWKDKQSGDKMEETEWHRVSLFDRLAEIAGEYLKKGSPVYIEGRLKTRKWQDKDGKDNYTTEIMAESLQLLGGRDGGERDNRDNAPRGRGSNDRDNAPRVRGDDRGGEPRGNQQRASHEDNLRGGQQRGGGGGGSMSGTGFDSMDDDIPFISADPSIDPIMIESAKIGRARRAR